MMVMMTVMMVMMMMVVMMVVVVMTRIRYMTTGHGATPVDAWDEFQCAPQDPRDPGARRRHGIGP